MPEFESAATGEAPPLSVLYSFPHALGAPGIGTTAWNQISTLVAAGHRVTVVTTSVARPVPGAVRVITSLAIGGRRIPHRAIGRDRAFVWHDLLTSRVLRSGSFDVVHTWPLSGERTMAAATARGIASLREAPNTHTAHAYEIVEAEYRALNLATPENSHKFNSQHLAREQREWAAATAILVPSDHVAATFVERGIDPAKLLRHQYGYNPADISSPKMLSTPQSGDATSGPARPFTVVFAGSGTPRKGLHYALEAWHAMGPERGDGIFRIHGAIESGYADFLRPLLDHPSVQVRGFTTPAKAMYVDADVLLLPSIEEGSALVTYEAQAAGCVPLISTAAGAVVTHNVHGLLHTPGDVATLSAQLSDLARDPELLARLRREAINHSPALTWEAARVTVEHAYRGAIIFGSTKDRAVR